MQARLLSSDPAPCLLASLRATTREVHERLHRHPLLLPLTSDEIGRDHYLAVLTAFYGFYAPCEAQLARPGSAARLGWLAQDLDYFGVDRSRVPVMARTLCLRSRSAQLGYRYVVEGSSLGARLIVRALRRSLGLSIDSGARFFAAHGAETGAIWRSIGLSLQHCPFPRESVVAAALETFLTLEAWLWQCQRERL